MHKIYINQLLKNKWKIISFVFEILGIVTLLIDILYIFIPTFMEKLNLSWIHLIILLTISFCVSIYKNSPKLKRKYTLKNRDINITIVVGDIFKQPGAKVIPTNTSFDTTMDDEFISINSIQGQFQNIFFKNNLGNLDNQIEYSLKEVPILKKYEDGRKTKTNCYACGTVAKITHTNNRYYFLGLADVNKNGKPNAEYENILIALQGLWDYLLENGHIENLVIPIIGTGKAGIAEATRMKVLKDTIYSFVAMSNEKKITNNLILCIHPDDLLDNKINIDEVFEFVDYLSKYKYDELDTRKNGKSL